MQARLAALDDAVDRARDRTLGVCVVCHEDVEPGRLEMDYTSCVCLDHLSPAERRRLEAELELSARLQQALLPQQVPAIPGLDLAVFSRPAAIVGGDYFDFYRFRDGAHGLVIGDAVGHGVSAGLLITYLLSALRLLVPDHEAPADVLERLNGIFTHSIHLTSFVTLFLARFDARSARLTYSSAGHNPPLLFRPRARGDEAVSWLDPTGAAIGLVDDLGYGEATVTLRPGELLLLYTDGVTEATDPQGEEFGRQRLADVVWERPDHPAQALVRAVRERLEAFTGGRPPVDDTTIVAYRVG